MSDGSLSQDEIDALLQGSDDAEQPASQTAAPQGQAPPAQTVDQNAVKEIFSTIISGSVLPALSMYLGGRNIHLTNITVEAKPQNAIANDFPGKNVQVDIDYQGSLNGRNLIIFNTADAGRIGALMMGNDSGASVELTEAHLSTVQEFVNQFLSLMANQLSSRTGGNITTTPPAISVADSPASLQIPQANPVKITYDFNIEGIASVKMFHVLDGAIVSAVTPASGTGMFQQQALGVQQNVHQADISSVKYPQFGETGMAHPASTEISMLLDVPMTLTVELGRTSRLVKEILGLGEGSVIELDKLAGEPVDLLVNGKLLAKGEVVVIDENFGVRITDIVTPDERFAHVSQQ